MTETELLEECRDRFEYSEVEKGLVGKITNNRLKLILGRRVGNSHHSGYKYVKIKGKLYAEHILVYLMQTGLLPSSELDHKNLDKMDNRFENLRLITRQGNCANRETWNKLGYKGVGVNKRGLPFNASIKYNGKTLWLGSFGDIESAAKAYDVAAINYFGDNARLNFKEESIIE